MPIITLDNNGLRDAIMETVKQAAEANARLSCDTGLTIGNEFDMTFTAVVVVKGGLNAVTRRTTNEAAGTKVAESITEPVVEVTTRTGNQTSLDESESTNEGTDAQDSTTEDLGTSEQTSTADDTSTNEGDSTETSSSEQATVSESAGENSNKQNTENVQTHGTKQTTTNDYAR
jgi:hypothetical protein